MKEAAVVAPLPRKRSPFKQEPEADIPTAKKSPSSAPIEYRATPGGFQPYRQLSDNKPLLPPALPLLAQPRTSPSALAKLPRISPTNFSKPPPSSANVSTSSTGQYPLMRVAPILTSSHDEKPPYCATGANSDRQNCHPPPPLNFSSVKLRTGACHDGHDCAHCAAKMASSHHQRTPSPPRACPCAMCSRRQDSRDCHGAPPPLYPPATYKPLPPPPLSTCRDPNCTACPAASKLVPSPLTNFLHPALIHQCTHSYTGLPVAPGGLPVVTSAEAVLKNSPTAKTFVCNWVSEGHHCGKTFPSSEDLFQHLRSHTSLQQQQQNSQEQQVASAQQAVSPARTRSPPTGGCGVHGCPCRKSPSGGGRVAAGFPFAAGPVRYSPYARNGAASFHGHGYASHGGFHY